MTRYRETKAHANSAGATTASFDLSFQALCARQFSGVIAHATKESSKLETYFHSFPFDCLFSLGSRSSSIINRLNDFSSPKFENLKKKTAFLWELRISKYNEGCCNVAGKMYSWIKVCWTRISCFYNLSYTDTYSHEIIHFPILTYVIINKV